MLVLSRKKNETIRIGRDVTLCVVEIRGDKVRLGINAPEAVPVHREEVFRAIERESGPRPLPTQTAVERLPDGVLDLGGSIVVYPPEDRR